MSFHDLRHTFATLQLNGKQPLMVVSEMMGHTKVSITQDLYTHVSAQTQRGAAAALDDLLGPEPQQLGGRFRSRCVTLRAFRVAANGWRERTGPDVRSLQIMEGAR